MLAEIEAEGLLLPLKYLRAVKLLPCRDLFLFFDSR